VKPQANKPRHKFVVDDRVVELFVSRPKREREVRLMIFSNLAKSPYRRGEWLQWTSSGRELQVSRFGKNK
jgi:hypothetical protein